MNKDNKLIKYNKNPIIRFFSNIWSKIRNRYNSKPIINEEINEMIINEYPNIQEQQEAIDLLNDLSSRNQFILQTLDIRMLNKKMLDLFGKPLLERIVLDPYMQSKILELSEEQLKTYEFLLKYKTTNITERITNLNLYMEKGINYDNLQNLNELDKCKAVSILLSNSNFYLHDSSKLNIYYENRKKICKKIIDNPSIIDEIDFKEYYNEFWDNKENDDTPSDIPIGMIIDLRDLNLVERVQSAIIEAKYGMTLEKAKDLCVMFGKDIDYIEQSEETRIIREIKQILGENNIENLRNIDLNENVKNYEGTLNIVSNLRNSYLHEYQKTLYQIKDEDYIETQNGIKIYNALGKNNDKAEFNMILTALGGIYPYSHDVRNIKKDWDRADGNHSISCSYIGNDFLGVTFPDFLLGFADIKENELLVSRNQDAGVGDSPFDIWYSECEFLVPKNQIDTSKIYNEMVVERKIEKDGKLVNRKPTYVVFLAENINDIKDKKNHRWKNAKKMAKELDIPIVVIDVQKCAKLEWNKTQEMIKLIKEQKRMDLIPQVIQKFENNRGVDNLEFEKIYQEIFSNEKIKESLEEIIRTIITSDNETFNIGIEEFVKATKKIMKNYEGERAEKHYNDKFKTYDYQGYIERLRILYGSRNGLFNKGENGQEPKEIIRDNQDIDEIRK